MRLAMSTVHDEHLPALRALRAANPSAERFGYFNGGMVWRLKPHGYLAVLLPPIGRAADNLNMYLGEHFDTPPTIGTHSYYGQVEAIRLG